MEEVFEHQRMDFFMLFSLKYRVVIEIDGQQHYADDEIAPGTRYKHYASPQRYANGKCSKKYEPVWIRCLSFWWKRTE